MKAISLYQPWASAIAVGAKRIETRGWATAYRGPLAIHAAKRCVKLELRGLMIQDHWTAALRPLFPDSQWDIPWAVLPFGAVVAVCHLVACLPARTFSPVLDEPYVTLDGHWTERQMGDFGPGRYGWVLEGVWPLKRPIPFRGRQRLFNVPDALLAEVL